MAAKREETITPCAYVVGDDGLSSWSDVARNAWIGMLETHKRLTRELEAELEADFGLSMSALELLGRLAAADDRVMRLTALAEATGLSLSRVSRIVDTLEARKLVERTTCPGDARAVNALLTDAGLELARKAQGAHFASVEERFFHELNGEEVEVLASVFGRFAPQASEACTE
jgi:DNA-binding MarR family transcriptional regulator